jgi:hypothetical protein
MLVALIKEKHIDASSQARGRVTNNKSYVNTFVKIKS